MRLYSIIVISTVLVLVFLYGCKNDKQDRNYQEVEIPSSNQADPHSSADPHMGMADPHSGTDPHQSADPHMGMTSADSQSFLQSANSASLMWQVPEGWVQIKPTGIRAAAFSIRQGNNKTVCTIIQLPGEAGGLPGNVKRWMGQLHLIVPAVSQLSAYLDKQQRFETSGGMQGVLVDMTTVPAEVKTSDLSGFAAVITNQGKTIFVKLFAPKSLLNENRAKFLKLCQSIKNIS